VVSLTSRLPTATLNPKRRGRSALPGATGRPESRRGRRSYQKTGRMPVLPEKTARSLPLNTDH
jgi:hypothetical protein